MSVFFFTILLFPLFNRIFTPLSSLCWGARSFSLGLFRAYRESHGRVIIHGFLGSFSSLSVFSSLNSSGKVLRGNTLCPVVRIVFSLRSRIEIDCLPSNRARF